MGYVFISYSSKNRDVADKLIKALEKNNIDSWVAPDDIPAGSKYAQVINKAIKNCACFVLLLSNDSMNSVWVAKEVERAINYNKKIITVKIEDLTLTEEFELYISTDQIVQVYDIAKIDDEVNRLISVVKAHTTSYPFEKKDLEQELLGIANEGSHTPPAQKKYTSVTDFVQNNKRKLTSKDIIIISVCSAVVALVLIATLVTTSFRNQNNNNEQPDDYQTSSTNMSETQNEQNNTVSSTEAQKESTSQALTGENQIPKEHENAVMLLKYADDPTRKISTIKVKVGEYAAPHIAWTNYRLYSENTDIAVGEGVLIKGVSKGETYVILEAATGNTQAYYVIVE